MDPIEWWSGIKELERVTGTGPVPNAEPPGLRAELERAGSVLVQSNSPALGNAFLSGELDPGVMLRTFTRSVQLAYLDPDDTSLCREISDMKTQLQPYVFQLIAATGWTLGPSPSNMDWLYHALEHPALVAAYPDWFEDVVQKHPWAWSIVLGEQFYMTSNSPCRDFLYDPQKKPWEAFGVVDKMVPWLYYKESQAPQKAVLARQAWPEWMDHLRDYTQLHYQLIGPPDPAWMPEEAWAQRYFYDVAEQAVQHWNTKIQESWDYASLLPVEP